MNKLISNTTAIRLLNHKVFLQMVVNIGKDVMVRQSWHQPCLVRLRSNGNDKNQGFKKMGNDKSGKTVSSSRGRKSLSPATRLAEMLPPDYHEPGLGREEEHRDRGNIRKTNQEDGICSNTNISADSGEHDFSGSSLNIKWKVPNKEREELLTYDDDYSELKKNDKLLVDDMGKRLKTFRGRSLSPLQRLSEQIPPDFRSKEKTDVRSTTDALRDVDKQMESQTVFGKETVGFKDLNILSESDVNISEQESAATLTFQYGCYVTICLHGWSKGPRRYMFKLEQGKSFRIKSYGQLCHDDIEGKMCGQLLRVSLTKMALITYPSLEEYVTMISKKTIIANPKTVSMMISMADLREGSRVLEAGTGSGATTLFLSRAVGSTGHVMSVEKRLSYSDLAQNNICNWRNHCTRLGRPFHPNITFVHGDITEPHSLETVGDLENLDAVFLDVKTPSDALARVVNVVRPGCPVLIYCPSISSVLSCVKKINDCSLPLKVDGIYEDTEKLWNIKCLSHVDGESDTSRTICHPCPCDENKTVFIIKLIKIDHVTKKYDGRLEATEDLAERKTSHEINSSNFRFGHHVLVEYFFKSKQGRDATYLTNLKENGQLQLCEGNLKHTEIVGFRPGNVLNIQKFPLITIQSPTLESYVDSLLSNGKNIRHSQHYSLVCHFLDVKKGDTILHVGKQSKQCSAYALYLSQAVGEEGNVYCLTGSEPDGSDCEKNLCTWSEMYNQTTRKHCPKNIQFGNLHDPALSFPNLSSLQFDGVSVDVPLSVLMDKLSFITSGLKSGSRIIVSFASMTSVIQLLHWLQRSSLPLFIKTVHEETEREWIAQPVKMNSSIDAYCEQNWPYICRPKQNMRKVPGFIAIILKAWEMPN